eukprot:TRINITY_DN14715_c0_g3_i5.p1 TRINITY_DN14715_c0_g3~~TRINITY_DN14715_c0_g3_i5.p1  ORF type:complete len:1193 (-),score=511.78 TRINITY_DN14715_c0_g3_i5:143-3721(-)
MCIRDRWYQRRVRGFSSAAMVSLVLVMAVMVHLPCMATPHELAAATPVLPNTQASALLASARVEAKRRAEVASQKGRHVKAAAAISATPVAADPAGRMEQMGEFLHQVDAMKHTLAQAGAEVEVGTGSGLSFSQQAALTADDGSTVAKDIMHQAAQEQQAAKLNQLRLKDKFEQLQVKLRDDQHKLSQKRELEQIRRAARAQVRRGEVEIRAQEAKAGLQERFAEQEADLRRQSHAVTQKLSDDRSREIRSERQLAEQLEATRSREEEQKLSMESQLGRGESSAEADQEEAKQKLQDAKAKLEREQAKLVSVTATEKHQEAAASKLKMKQKELGAGAGSVAAALTAYSSEMETANAQNAKLRGQLARAEAEISKLSARSNQLDAEAEGHKLELEQAKSKAGEAEAAQKEIQDTESKISQSAAEAKTLRDGMKQAQSDQIKRVQSLKQKALHAEMAESDLANQIELKRSKEQQEIVLMERKVKQSENQAELEKRELQEKEDRALRSAQDKMDAEVDQQKQHEARLEQQLRQDYETRQDSLSRQRADQQANQRKREEVDKKRLEQERAETATETRKLVDAATASKERVAAEARALKHRVQAEEQQAAADATKEVADLKTRAAQRIGAMQKQAQELVEQAAQATQAATEQAAATANQLNQERQEAFESAKVLAEQKIAGMKARAKISLEESVKMANSDKDSQIEQAETDARAAEEKAGVVAKSEDGMKQQKEAMEENLRSTTQELKDELETTAAKLKQAKSQEQRLRHKIEQVRSIIARSRLKTDKAKNNSKKLMAFRLAFRNKLADQRSHKLALDKQLKSIQFQTEAQRQNEQTAQVEQEQARDEEMQLEHQFETLQHARKTVTAKAAADAVHQAKNQLQRVEATAAEREASMSDDEKKASAMVRKLQEEAVQQARAEEELSGMAGRLGRRLLGAPVLTLTEVERSAFMCAHGCDASHKLERCMDICIKHQLGNWFGLHLKPKKEQHSEQVHEMGEQWSESNLEELAMVGAMSTVMQRADLATTSQLAPMLQTPPTAALSSEQVQNTYQRFNGFLETLTTPAAKQRVFARAELAKQKLLSELAKRAVHVDPAPTPSQDAAPAAGDANQAEGEVKLEDIGKEEEERRAVEVSATEQLKKEEEAQDAKEREAVKGLPKKLQLRILQKQAMRKCSNKCSGFAPCMFKCMRRFKERNK